MTLDRYTLIVPDGMQASCRRTGDCKEEFRFTWTPGTAQDGQIVMKWRESGAGIAHEWFPTCGFDRGLRTDWYPDVYSRISCGAPVFAFLGSDGYTRLTVALSDAKTNIGCNFGIMEETSQLAMRVTIPLASFDRLGQYTFTLYISRLQEDMGRALDKVRLFWEAAGYTPMPVPEAARLPLYSAWYSYHQATIAHLLEAESEKAAALGLKTIIVDDGWQTDDGNRGYAYCGDWEVTPRKIPDMRQHVANVQKTGLKYMLWYSVPFIGRFSKAWSRFENKLLYTQENGNVGVLDPRYPDVRDYLIGIYLTALREWKLDGFKLDFIDSFTMKPESAPFTDGMDIPVLADAVDTLMQGIRAALMAEKPDILLEFRQQYIGPLMRGYGNMFRAGDCPMCPDKNRVSIVDLRMICGNTAPHSDMLMWDPADTPENGLRQLLHVIFSVPQISMRIGELPESHVKALRFWLSFIDSHRDLLLDSPLKADLPQFLYPVITAGQAGRYVIGVYQPGHTASLPEDAREIFLVNGTDDGEILLRAPSAQAHLETWNVTGDKVFEGDISLTRLCAVDVPVCGLARITIR